MDLYLLNFFPSPKSFSLLLALVCSRGSMHTGSISGELEFSGFACLFTVTYLYVCFLRAWPSHGVVVGSLIKMLGIYHRLPDCNSRMKVCFGEIDTVHEVVRRYLLFFSCRNSNPWGMITTKPGLAPSPARAPAVWVWARGYPPSTSTPP